MGDRQRRKRGPGAADRQQLSALFAAGIKLDLRASRAMHGRTRVPPLVIALVVYAMMGTVLAFAMLRQEDPFVYSLFTISAAMFMTALMVIMEYSTVVVNPDDFDIMAHRPVSSKTYFWAKIANLLFFVVATAGALTLPAAVIGGTMMAGPVFIPTYLASALAACIAVAGLAVLLYSLALRIWSYERFTSVITYVHTVATFVLVLGYVFLPRALGGDAAIPMVHRGNWVFAAPPAWFAAATQLALGTGTTQDALLALMALGGTVAVVFAAANTISLDYSRKLSELAASSRESEAPSATGAFKGPLGRLGLALCKNDAERVGFALLAAYTRRDKKLRARIFPAFGLPLAAYVAGLLTGELSDPLVSGGDSGMGLLQILGFYSMFVGFFFASGLTQSDQWKASWVFYTAPIEQRADILMGARKLVVAQFLIPFFIVLLILLSFVIPPASAAAFMLVVFLLAIITFAFLSLSSPNLPLSQSVEKSRQARQIALMMLMGVFIGVQVAALKAMQDGFVPGAIAVGVLLAGAVATEALVRRHLRRRLAREEYQG